MLKLAHDSSTTGHLGKEKTLALVLIRCFWPGIHWDIKDYCASCPECQLAAAPGVLRVPLVLLLVVGMPFEIVTMDPVGPLKTRAAGF